jgi:uncharacterized membrane protein
MKTNRIITVGALVAVALSVPFFGSGWNRFLHLLGAVLFVGNIVVSAVWLALARRSGEPEACRLGVRGVVLTDALFTLPGVILLFVNGGILGTPWLKAGAAWIIISVLLFVITGVVWGAVLVPIQRRLARLVDGMPPHGPLPAECEALFAKWFRWGGVATLLPLVTLVLMVFKPAF